MNKNTTDMESKILNTQRKELGKLEKAQ